MMLVYYSMIYKLLVNGLSHCYQTLNYQNLKLIKLCMLVYNSASNYDINDTLISVSACEKILRVILDDDMSFKIHIY